MFQCSNTAAIDRQLSLEIVMGKFSSLQDQVGYKKASKDGYFMLADRLDQAGFDQISIEDAHRHNDLSLFQHFKKSKVLL